MPIRKLSLEEFPGALREIPEPPESLWIRGELPDHEENIFLAVVGSRKNTSYGRDACERLISGLRGYPVVIVSGLALGIDGIAHRAALDAGLKTLAIPGSGLDPRVLYPRAHLSLAEEIISKGGALISEYEPDFRATEWSFPRRNRIMAGLSKAVLIVEAEEKSGTLITARLALDYNRDVLAVPGGIFSPMSSGTNRLLKHGATPITASDELLRALGFDTETDAKTPDISLSDATEDEIAVWELLHEPKSRDILYKECSLSMQDFNTALSLLEIKGLIAEEAGEIRRII